MRKLVVILPLLLNVPFLYSQAVKYPNDSTYSFLFFEGQIADTSMLELKVRYINLDKEIILTHKELIDDNEYGPVGNIYVEMEKLKDGKYSKFVDKIADYFLGENRPQERSHYKELRPGDSVVLNFNLISRIGAFYKGKYRIRFHLLKVPNNYPIRHDIEYTKSRWFDIEIMKDLDYHDLY